LVQALSTQFEKQVVAIFSSYVSALLQEYSTNPQKNWRQKDVVLFLVTTLASRAQTKKVIFICFFIQETNLKKKKQFSMVLLKQVN